MLRKIKEKKNMQAAKDLIHVIPNNSTNTQLISIIFECLLLIAAQNKKGVRRILDSLDKEQPAVLWAVSTEFVRLAATSREYWSLLVEFRIHDHLLSVANWNDIAHPPVLIAFAYLVDNPNLAGSYLAKALAAQSSGSTVDEVFRRSIVFILNLSMVNQCIHFLSTHLSLLDLPKQVSLILEALPEIGPGRIFALMCLYATKIGSSFPKDALKHVALAALESDCAASSDELRAEETFKRIVEVGVVDGKMYDLMYRFYVKIGNTDQAAQVVEQWLHSGSLAPMCDQIAWASPEYATLYVKLKESEFPAGLSSDFVFVAAAERSPSSEELSSEWTFWIGKGAKLTERSLTAAMQSCIKRGTNADLARVREFVVE